MAFSYESHVSLSFDTGRMRAAADRYQASSEKLQTLKTELEQLLALLSRSDWTTEAGKAFEEMVKTDWSGNLDRYCDLISTLSQLLRASADEYEGLVSGQVDQLRI